jgi:very-short-patch-repair endonuclease
MIDGIEHYAEKIGNRWDAKEEKYAARLKEDRLLRLQGWNVFRVGNWEVKEPTRLELVLDELRRFIGFESPPIPPPLDDEDIPF